MADVSVVIPTFNRLAQLERTLVGLESEVEGEHDVEVVVVSDGSTDGTDEWLRSGSTPVPVIVRSQPNRGPAVARNHGVAVATAPLVLFLDDDVVPKRGLVGTHLRHHLSPDDDLVVIGPMLTPDDVVLAPWVMWEQRQLYKQYEAMERGEWTATPRQFYTANASLARRHFESAGGFDPSFRRAEDVELAYRLADAGLGFTFVPDAGVLHYADRSFQSWLANASAYGRNDVIFGRDLGQRWLLDDIAREFHRRHPLVRVTTRAAIRRPRMGRAVAAGGSRVARLFSAVGPDRLAAGALSALYNLEYYLGMAEEIADRGQMLALLERRPADAVGEADPS